MGRRWRRNNNNNKKQQQQQQKQQDVERRQQDQWRDEDAADDENGGDAPGGGGDTNPSTTQAFWNQEEDRDDLLRYLESYKRACIERHETFLVRKVTTKTDGSRQEGNQQVEHEAPVTAATVIGGVIMPPLTTTTGGDGDGDAKELSHDQPFLVLPKCLSSKQRRMVHECCVEVDLFHRTFEEGGEGGDHANNRYVAISIYADAFDGGLPTMEKRDGSSPVPVYKYRPWYYSARRRKMEDESRRRREALDSIDALLDQPGECLRDGLDEVDFEAAVGDDLSDIDPPSAAAAAAAAASPHEDLTAWTLVESKGAMLACVAELQATKPTEMAFDLEAVNKSKHAQLTCLLQIAVPVKDPGGENKKQTKSATVKEYVIDTLAPGVWDEVPKLAPFFADPKIVKVGHSVGGLDVRCLHRDFGIYVVNVFDTYEASRALPLRCGFGLAKLCRHYNVQNSERYRDLKSKYQRCDWRVRPLSDEMIEYGRNDVHYLLKLRQLMIRDLTKYDLYLYDQTLKRQKLESEMVAESLAATLQHIQEAEGDDGSSLGGETFRTTGAETFKTTVQPAADTALTEEENGVPSLIKSRDLEEDFFFTPMTSYNSAVESISGDVPAGQEEGEGEEDNIVSVKEDENEDENKITQQLEIPRRTLKASAAVLRMHPQLMTVLTRSQERCKGFWTDDSTEDSNPLKHPALTTLLKRSKKKVKRAGGGDISWSNVQTQLYLDLFEWRSSVASGLQCLPDFVAPVDFLVDVAWKRPTFVEAVRRISFNLPVALEENAQFVEQMLLIVRRSVGKVPNSAGGRTKVYWYYSDREESDTLDLMEKDGGAGSSTRAVTVMKVALAASIVAAVAFIVLSPKSRSKLRPSCY